MSRAAIFGRYAKVVQRDLAKLGREDAQRTPLQTPCLDLWRQRPGDRGPAWAAACWEAAALDTRDDARRAVCFAYARSIIAEHRGEIGPVPPDAR